MNKTTQINLGGIPFTLDEDAYRRLDLYLTELEEHFAYSENSEEILQDIESRLAELVSKRLKGRSIVNMHDVADTIRVMGRPGDFDTEPITAEPLTDEPRRPDNKPWDIRTGKRLFRDPDDQVVGGVCSGLSAYFGINDPIWVRLGFVIFTLTVGFGVLAYIIAWILIPEAKTASDRLAMRGEPANVKNIAGMIERGLDDISDTIKDNWKDFKRKKKSSGRTNRRSMRRSDQGGFPALNEPKNTPLPDKRDDLIIPSKSTGKYRNLLV